MFDKIAPYYDTANRFMSLGLDQSWRRKLVSSLRVQLDDTVCDLSTGTADVAIVMAQTLIKRVQELEQNNTATGASHQLKTTITGIDPSSQMLAIAHTKIESAGLGHIISLVNQNAEHMDQIASGRFDKLSMSFGIRNVPDRTKALLEIRRIVKTGGRVAIMEFVQPKRGPLAPLARLFLEYVIPTVGQIASNGHASEYDHLRKSILEFPSPSAFTELMSTKLGSHCSAEDIFFDLVYIFSCDV